MRTALAILLLVVIAALGWLLFDAPPTLPAPAPGADADASTPGEPRSAPPPALASADRVAVIVDMEVRAHIEAPLPAPRFEVQRGGQRLSLPVEIMAGAGALAAMAGDRTLVRIDLGALGSCWRAVTAAADEPTAIVYGPSCKLAGRVADAGHAPVAGARVWTGDVDPDGRLREVETDADGAFAVDVMQGEGVPCVVQMAGLASRVQWLDLGPNGASEVLLTMEPETIVAVQCAAVADALVGAEVGVLPGTDASTSMLQWPFFLQVVQGLVGLDDSGRALLRGLPRGCDFRLVVRHPLAMLPPPVDVKLRGEHATATLPLHLLPPVSGRVVDAAGAPVAAASVRLQLRDPAPLPSGRWMLPDSLCLIGACTTSTDQDGGFRIGFAGARGRLTLQQRGGAVLRLEVARAGELERQLVLPEWTDVATELQVPAASAAPWQLRIKPVLDDFVDVAAAQPFAQPLPAPVLADLRVLVRRDGKWSTARELRDAVVIGCFALPPRLLQ